MFDFFRKPRRFPPESTRLEDKTTLGKSEINIDLSCPVCMNVLKNTMTMKDCLHRFCGTCIERYITFGKKECPNCRKQIKSKRTLRPDPIFDAMVSRLYGNINPELWGEKSNTNEQNKKRRFTIRNPMDIRNAHQSDQFDDPVMKAIDDEGRQLANILTERQNKRFLQGPRIHVELQPRTKLELGKIPLNFDENKLNKQIQKQKLVCKSLPSLESTGWLHLSENTTVADLSSYVQARITSFIRKREDALLTSAFGDAPSTASNVFSHSGELLLVNNSDSSTEKRTCQGEYFFSSISKRRKINQDYVEEGGEYLLKESTLKDLADAKAKNLTSEMIIHFSLSDSERAERLTGRLALKDLWELSYTPKKADVKDSASATPVSLVGNENRDKDVYYSQEKPVILYYWFCSPYHDNLSTSTISAPTTITSTVDAHQSNQSRINQFCDISNDGMTEYSSDINRNNNNDVLQEATASFPLTPSSLEGFSTSSTSFSLSPNMNGMAGASLQGLLPSYVNNDPTLVSLLEQMATLNRRRLAATQALQSLDASERQIVLSRFQDELNSLVREQMAIGMQIQQKSPQLMHSIQKSILQQQQQLINNHQMSSMQEGDNQVEEEEEEDNGDDDNGDDDYDD